MFFTDPGLNSLASLILVVLGIGIVIFVVMQISKLILKLVVGIVINSVLGFIALFIIGWLFGITITYTLPVLLSIAIFGLPAVGTLLLLKFIGGVALVAIA